MISTLFHNNISPKESSMAAKKTVKAIESPAVVNMYSKKDLIANGIVSGGMFGLGLGVGDALYSNYAQCRDINRSLKAYKNSTFEQKKIAILNLHNNGMTVKDYKNIIKAFKDHPISISVLKRGALYASIAAVACFIIHKLKTPNNKQQVQ